MCLDRQRISILQHHSSYVSGVVRWSWVNFQYRGVLVGQGPIALAVGAGGGCLDIFTFVYLFSPLFAFEPRLRFKIVLSPTRIEPGTSRSAGWALQQANAGPFHMRNNVTRIIWMLKNRLRTTSEHNGR